MMDRIVPGGVAADLTGDGVTTLRLLVAEVRKAFPELVELYDNTASLQDRTVTTGIVSKDLARQYAAGGYVGRASGRDIDARRVPGTAPYDVAVVRPCRCCPKATSTRASGSASARSSRACR